VSEGDKVEAGDLLAEIETDKATMEVEAVDEGVLGKILVSEGTQDVKVNQAIALLLEDGEDASALEGYESKGETSSATVETPEDIKEETPSLASSQESFSSARTSDRVFASPLAKRIALDKGVDLHTIKGSGPHGRIVKRDVEEIRGGSRSTTSSMQQPASSGPEYEDIPLTNMRKIIAKRLLESKQTVPHFYLTIDCQLDELLSVRKQLNQGLEQEGKKVTVNDFVIKAVAMALYDTPDANACWMGESIRRYKHSDVSVAVAIEDGLVTPIIKKAELKSIVAISDEMKILATKAKQGKLKPEEFQGGSFSISNLGMFGIKQFNAIINPPQACIMAVGAGEQRPVIVDGEIKPRTVVSITLSSDHRVVDGKVGADFLAAFKKYMENPVLMLIQGQGL
jgi:pyruvate dehydrogenase E2 component (dihydrolipoamide acetyltransferase)